MADARSGLAAVIAEGGPLPIDDQAEELDLFGDDPGAGSPIEGSARALRGAVLGSLRSAQGGGAGALYRARQQRPHCLARARAAGAGLGSVPPRASAAASSPIGFTEAVAPLSDS
jgi:hypothetical protein